MNDSAILAADNNFLVNCVKKEERVWDGLNSAVVWLIGMDDALAYFVAYAIETRVERSALHHRISLTAVC